jgi:alkylhydroperoxidase family enzyme
MHLAPKPIHKYPWYLRLFYSYQQKKMGQILIPGLFWGRFPCLQVLFLFFWRYLDRQKSTIDPALRALVQVRVAQLNSCNFCIDLNSLNLLNRTNSLTKVDVLDEWTKHPIFVAHERAALAYVDIVSGTHINVTKEVMASLKSHFNDEQIIELTALISFQNMSAKFNAALDIPSQGLCTPSSRAKIT